MTYDEVQIGQKVVACRTACIKKHGKSILETWASWIWDAEGVVVRKEEQRPLYGRSIVVNYKEYGVLFWSPPELSPSY